MWRKIILTLFTKGYAAVGNLFLVLLTANLLGADSRGQIALVILAVSIVGMAQSVVGGASLTYFANKRDKKSLLQMSMLWSILISITIGLFLPFIALAPYKYTLYLIGISALQGVITIQHSYLVGREEISKYVILDSVRTTALIAFLLIRFFIFDVITIEEVLNAYLVGNGISIIGGWIILPKLGRTDALDKAMLTEMITYGAQIQLNNLSQLFNYRFVYYLVEKLKGMEALGVFSVAVSIAESLWIICRSISTIQLSRIINEPDPIQQRSITKRLSVVSTGATAIAILFLILLPRDVYILIFGAEFGAIPEIVMWFSPAILFLAFYTILNHYFSGKDMNWINIKASLFGNLILVIVSYLMIEKFGLNGAALAYGFAFLGMSAYLIWAFYRVGKVEDQTNSIVGDHE